MFQSTSPFTIANCGVSLLENIHDTHVFYYDFVIKLPRHSPNAVLHKNIVDVFEAGSGFSSNPVGQILTKRIIFLLKFSITGTIFYPLLKSKYVSWDKNIVRLKLNNFEKIVDLHRQKI